MMRNKKFIYEIQDCSILHQEYNTYALKNFNDWTIFVVELTTDSLITERRLYRRKIPGESTEKLAENKDSREIALF